MALEQRVLFTALPNGGTSGRYQLSVHIAPRLRDTAGETTLGAFADWVNWPETLASIRWGVRINGIVVPAHVTAAPDSGLWTALFPPETRVEAFKYTAYDGRKVRSYPVRNAMEFLRSSYQSVGVNAGFDHPPIDLLLQNVFPDICFWEKQGTAKQIEGELAQAKAITNGPVDPRRDLFQLERFHRSRSVAPAPAAAPAGSAPGLLRNADGSLRAIRPPRPDFHQAVAFVGQHPVLMRKLGFVVDLEFDLPASNIPAPPTVVSVVAKWAPVVKAPGGVSPNVLPRTRSAVTTTQFHALPRAAGAELTADGRYLPLNDAGRYDLVQVDVDGAGIKTIDLAQNLTNVSNQLTMGAPTEYALPSLRSAGVSVARINRAPSWRTLLVDSNANNTKIEAGQVVTLSAEDLTRGYRYDVWDGASGTWHSLCARKGRYVFTNPGTEVQCEDEGFVSTVPTTAADGSSTDLYLQESLMRWGGWSLVAPRPGGRISTETTQDPPVTFEPNSASGDFKLEVKMQAAPGTLPRLRFGQRYRMRARAVDLAGNGAPPEPAVDGPAPSEVFRYLRYEPIPAPEVLPRRPRTEGESLEHVVIRSNYDVPPDGAVEVSRHIAPPKIDQILAEVIGMFDTAGANSVVSKSAYQTIAPYKGLQPPPAPAPVVPAEQGSYATTHGGKEDKFEPHGTRYFPGEFVPVPYLPDPMARAAMFRFMDLLGMDPAVPVRASMRPAVGQAWPHYQPLRMVLTEGPESPRQQAVFDEATRLFTVPLAKGDVATVRLSAQLSFADLARMGVWRWIVDGGGGALQADVLAGKHWMITPWRVLTLVHAVRQPLVMAVWKLKSPGVFDLSPFRSFGDTFCALNGMLHYSRKTTAKVDVRGRWTEFVDDGPGKAAPNYPEREATAFSIPGDRRSEKVLPEDLLPVDPRHDRHEFGDTKHRDVHYSTIATTAFAKYFVERRAFTVNNLPATLTLPTGGKGVVPGSVAVKNQVVKNPDGTISGAASYEEHKGFSVDVKAGAVKLHAPQPGDPPGTYVLPGQRVVVTFLVPPVVRPGPGETAPEALVDIPSSARPAPPKLVYAVPAFAWTETKDPSTGKVTSTMSGRTLRVYLERPWWSSGGGELLGVATWKPVGLQLDPPERLRPYVSAWAFDPVHSGNPLPKRHPKAVHFPLATTIGSGLALAELPDVVVDVAGHEVAYDADRGQWYTDIAVNIGGAYFPFVRMALVRYQPSSLPGVEISPVAQLDFMQLTPNRTLNVTRPDANTLEVSVTGVSYAAASESTPGPGVIRAVVERRDPDVPNDLGWSPVPRQLAVTLTPAPGRGGTTIWTGTLAAPSSAGEYRLLVEEFERYRVQNENQTRRLRLIYSNTIPLDPA